MASSNISILVQVLLAIVSVFIGYWFYNKPINENRHRKQPVNGPYIVLNDFVTESEEQELMKIFEDGGLFENAKADFSSKLWTDIGEGYTPTLNGSCLKHGSLLNKELNKCLFLPRLDAVRHYMTYGGYEGWKQRIPGLTSRISVFTRHEFNAYNRTEFKTLFEKEIFKNSVSKICPSTHPFHKPIELNLNIALPGQGFLAHHDAVYFINATRHQYPLWLLNIMKQSDLFDDSLLPQIQGIVYISSNNKSGGELYFYPNGINNDVELLEPKSKSAVLIDGTEIIHGTTVYEPSVKPLSLWQNTWSYLKFDHEYNVWRIYIDNKPTKHVYKWQDVRASLAYRALCFQNKNIMNQWTEYDIQSDLTYLSTTEILNKLKNDLIKKNIITESKWNKMNKDKYKLGLYLMEEYVKLPMPKLSWITFNYCIILDLLPKWFVDSVVGKTIERIWCQ